MAVQQDTPPVSSSTSVYKESLMWVARHSGANAARLVHAVVLRVTAQLDGDIRPKASHDCSGVSLRRKRMALVGGQPSQQTASHSGGLLAHPGTRCTSASCRAGGG